MARRCQFLAFLLLPSTLLTHAVDEAAQPRPGNLRGAVVFLTDGAPSRVADLAVALQSLDSRFNDRYHYPVVIFHSIDAFDQKSPPLTTTQEGALRASSRSSVTFALVNFTSYALAPGYATSPPVILGKGKGYRHMCRFFAGLVAHHPALASFDYYWRLDTDSELLEDVPFDIFAQLPCHGWRYAYAHAACDAIEATAGLWSVIAAHYALVSGGGTLASRLPSLLTEHGCPHSNDQENYNNVIFYNNFEIVDLAWLRSAEYVALFGAVDAAGGFYTKRWGDAPVRTLAAHALLPPAMIHRFVYLRFHHDMDWGKAPPLWWAPDDAREFPEVSGSPCIDSAANQRFYEPLRRAPPFVLSWSSFLWIAVGVAFCAGLCARRRKSGLGGKNAHCFAREVFQGRVRK